MDFETYKAVEKIIGTKDYSDKIIHYTKISNFENILNSRELWFGHISDMNDTSECQHFLSGIKGAFDKSFESLMLTDYWPIISSARSRILNETYVSSWCEYTSQHPDGSLPMWQEYGDNGQGIGLIVDSSNFQPSNLTPQKIQFFITNSQIEYLSSDRTLEYAAELTDRISKGIHFSDESLRLFSTALMLLAKAPTIKHQSYSHEREVRFLSIDPIPDIRPMRGGVLTTEKQISGRYKSFVRLPLKNYPSYGFDLSIEKILLSVLLGPGEDQDERSNKVRHLLDRFGLQHVHILRSSIPYRKR